MINSKILEIEDILTDTKKLYDSFENIVNSHISENKKYVEKLGLVKNIVVDNAYKLSIVDYEMMAIKFNKNKVNSDEATGKELIDEATKLTKDLLNKYSEFVEEKKNYISNLKSVENFDSESKFFNYLEDEESKFLEFLEYLKKFITVDLKKHIESFDSFKKYEKTYEEILDTYDISSRKAKGVYTELHELFQKSYIK